MIPTAPTNGVIVAATPGSVTVQFTGSAGVDHYDVYRSTSPLVFGVKVNPSPIAQPSSPFTFSFVDDVTGLLGAPQAELAYYYKAVAVDAVDGNSLPSNSVGVLVSDEAYVQDDIQQQITTFLKADPDLTALLQNDPMRIRWHHLTRESGDIYPFIVLKRSNWLEDKRFRDKRHGDLEYSFFVYSNQPSSKPVVQVINRMIKVLDGEGGKRVLSGVGADIFTCMMLNMGDELYDEALHLYFQVARLSLTVEFKESLPT